MSASNNRHISPQKDGDFSISMKQHEMFLAAKAKLKMIQSKKMIKQYRNNAGKRIKKHNQMDEYGQVLKGIKKEQLINYLIDKIGKFEK